MKTRKLKTKEQNALEELCQTVQSFIEQGRLDEAEGKITEAMLWYPHSAIPHNLMGIEQEYRGAHQRALRHFTAALALEPDYAPAQENLHRCSAVYDRKRNRYIYCDNQRKTKERSLLGVDLAGMNRVMDCFS